MNKEKLSDRAAEFFASGYNCAQSCFAPLAVELGLDESTALKIASAFGGGVARTGAVCGALSGVLLALGLRKASSEASPEQKDALYAEAATLIARFSEEFGAIDCRDLIQCDLSTSEGRDEANKRQVHSAICTNIVKKAVELSLEPYQEKGS